MVDARSMGDVLDHATRQSPEMRDLTVGEAVNAVVLNGSGWINPALDLVPHFFPHQPRGEGVKRNFTGDTIAAMIPD